MDILHASNIITPIFKTKYLVNNDWKNGRFFSLNTSQNKFHHNQTTLMKTKKEREKEKFKDRFDKDEVMAFT